MACLDLARRSRVKAGGTGLINKMFFTYILMSVKFRKFYTGHTDNMEKRLREHNSGKSIYSRKYMPWQIVYHEKFNSEELAIKREKYFKSASGRRWLKKNINI